MGESGENANFFPLNSFELAWFALKRPGFRPGFEQVAAGTEPARVSGRGWAGERRWSLCFIGVSLFGAVGGRVDPTPVTMVAGAA